MLLRHLPVLLLLVPMLGCSDKPRTTSEKLVGEYGMIESDYRYTMTLESNGGWTGSRSDGKTEGGEWRVKGDRLLMTRWSDTKKGDYKILELTNEGLTLEVPAEVADGEPLLKWSRVKRPWYRTEWFAVTATVFFLGGLGFICYKCLSGLFDAVEEVGTVAVKRGRSLLSGYARRRQEEADIQRMQRRLLKKQLAEQLRDEKDMH